MDRELSLKEMIKEAKELINDVRELYDDTCEIFNKLCGEEDLMDIYGEELESINQNLKEMGRLL